nr:MAG: putative capsid protein [Arizlama virus]
MAYGRSRARVVRRRRAYSRTMSVPRMRGVSRTRFGRAPTIAYARRSSGYAIPPMLNPNTATHMYDTYLGLAANFYSQPMNVAALGNVLDLMGLQTQGITAGADLTRNDTLQGFTGNRIWIESVSIRATIVLAAATPRGTGFLSLVWDQSPRGVVPTFLDCFDVSSSDAFQRVDQSARYRVLWRRDFNCEFASAGVLTTSSTHDLNVQIPIRRYSTCSASGAGMNVGACISGALFLMSYSTGNGVLEAPPYATSTCVHYGGRARIAFKAFA